MSDSELVKNPLDFIWSIAHLIRDEYRQSEYGLCRYLGPTMYVRPGSNWGRSDVVSGR